MTPVLLNFIQHPKTTVAGFLGGSVAGTAILGIVEQISHQAHCDFTLINWQGIGVIAIGAIMGMMTTGLMKDTTQAPVNPTKPTGG